MASLITTNPAVQGMQDAAALQQQSQAASFARLKYDEARRTADAERAVDDALRDMILGGGGLGQTGSDVGVSTQQAQPAAVGAGGMPAATPVQTAASPGGSLAQVPAAAPGPTATAARGDAPGFQSMLQQVLPPPQGQQPGYMPVPNATPGMSAGQPEALPNATPGMGGKLVQLQDPAMPGTITSPPAARTMGVDRQALAQRLAGIPGAGRAAFELIEQQEGMEAAANERQDGFVTNFFKSLDNNDIYSARYWAGQAGMNIPEDIYDNAETMEALAIAGKYKTLYGADLDGFGNFLSTAFQRRQAGDPRAFENSLQINRPRRVPGAGRVLSPENQLYQSLLQKHGGDSVKAYTEFQSLKAKTGGSGSTTFEQRKAFAEKLYPNDMEAQANFVNGGRRPTRTEIRKLAVDEMKSRYPGQYNTPRGAEYDRELEGLIKEYETLAWSQAAGVAPDEGASGGESVDFASQGRIPTPDDNLETYVMPDNSEVYTNDGVTWYDEAGNLVYGGTGN